MSFRRLALGAVAVAVSAGVILMNRGDTLAGTTEEPVVFTVYSDYV
jgi:hypothetical protein